MKERRRSRAVALQAAYAADANPEMDAATVLALVFERFGDTGESEDDKRTGETFDRVFAEALARGTIERRAELDEILGQLSRNWRIERMARVDRSILRLALWELKYRDDIPARVTINEAVELAKRFGAEEAPAFVNGLLDVALRILDVRK